MGSKKGKKEFEKGHEQFYHGKKVDEDLFFACLDLFALGRIKLPTACKIIGLSEPTLRKRYKHILERKEIPWENWFIGYDAAKGERMRKKVRKKAMEEAKRAKEEQDGIGESDKDV